VLTRVASSHIRVGTFEYFGSRGDVEGTRLLADHVMARHYPEVDGNERPYLALLAAIIEAQAQLIPQWLLVGFIHGVMNTDNMSVVGETIDYGPCAFIDRYDPKAVFSAIDRSGRYAYANQPAIAQWNLTRLAECLLPLIDEDADRAVALAEEALTEFGSSFQQAYWTRMRRKLGLFTEAEDDIVLGAELLDAMAAQGADFTLTFRRLGDETEATPTDGGTRTLFADPAAFDAWADKWRQRLSRESVDSAERRASMRAVNPAFIPRNHRVEAVIRAGIERDDFAPFEELVAVLAKPFEDQPEFAHYAEPPEEHEIVRQTFCGT
jgi:uncharacterized protein YdiU (UPF0061 family)